MTDVTTWDETPLERAVRASVRSRESLRVAVALEHLEEARAARAARAEDEE